MMSRKNLAGPWGLYAILDPEHCRGRDPAALARQALQNGAGALQWRDKCGSFEEQVEPCARLKALCDEFNVPFIVNDNPYLALEVGADGVHLGQGDVPVWTAREVLGKDRIIGLSTHTRKQAVSAADSGADYLGFGPMFKTKTKQQDYSALGVGNARWASQLLGLPIVAIGGVTPQRVARLVGAGVKTVAVISALFEADDPGAAAREFVEAMKR